MFTHPRDPYTRVDILPSSRHVRIEVDGVTIAETDEADAPLRDRPPDPLLPAQDARPHGPADPTDTVSHCPYKGQAEYWSLARRRRVRPDIAWSYRTPLPESQKIAGLISFYRRRSTSTSTGSSRLDLRPRPHGRRAAIRPSCSTRSRTGSSPPIRPAARCSATPTRAARDADLADPPGRAPAAAGVRRAASCATVTARRSPSPAERAPGTCLPTEMSLQAFEHDGRVLVLALIRDRSEHRSADRPLRRRSAATQPRPRPSAKRTTRKEQHDGHQRSDRPARGESRQGSRGRRIPARRAAARPGRAADHRLVRPQSRPVVVRDRRRLPRRAGTASAPRRRRRRRPDRRADELLAGPPEIEQVDVLAAKLP